MPRHVWSIGVRLGMAGNARDLARINMAVDSTSRGCGLVGLRVRDVFAAGRVKERAAMIRSTTGRLLRFEGTGTTGLSPARWISGPEMIGLEVPWPAGFMRARSLRQGSAHGWLGAGSPRSARSRAPMAANPCAGPGGARISRQTGTLRAVQLRLGHTEMGSTVRHLGVDLVDARSLSGGIAV